MSNLNNPNEIAQSGGIFRAFLNYYRVTYLLIIGLAIAGLFAVFGLPRESTPEVKIPYGIVVTAYPGASPRDVEELVTDPVEEKLENLEGVKQITSSSSLGISTVSVEFFADEDLDDSLRRLRDAVSSVSGLPAETEDPEVIELDFNNEPIISISLGGLDDTRLLSVYAEDLADRLKTIPDVSAVTVTGDRTEEIRIIIDPDKLANLGVSLNQILGAIRSSNVNAPFGQLETDQYLYDLRLQSRFTNVSDIASLPIRLPNQTVVSLDQIAQVSLALAEQNTDSRISLNREPSTPAVGIQVTKKTGGNIVNIVSAVKEEITATQSQLPPDVVIETFADRAEEIRTSLTEVSTSGLQTLIIVFIVLWLFLGWREALIAALAVPLTFFTAFIIFTVTDITLNGISLFSLILALGLLVDNAIVITEGIHRGRSKDNLTEHAGHIIDQFKRPLMSGTLTTVAAFFPMLLVTGIIGEFLRTIPIVVSATLLSSLLVALALIPPVAARALRKGKQTTQPRWFDQKFQQFRGLYERFLTWLLSRRRLQTRLIWILSAALVLGLSLPFTGLLKTGLFPNEDVDFILINLELPPGSRLDQTRAFAAIAEEQVHAIPEVKSYLLSLGSGTSLDFTSASSGSQNLASFYINLREDRDRSSILIANELRQKFAPLGSGTITVEDIASGPPTAPPVEVRVIGTDLDELDRTSMRLIDELKTIPGIIDADRNLRFSAGEFTFNFNQDALARHGISISDIGMFLRTIIYGQDATTFLNERGDEVAVHVEGEPAQLNSISQIQAIPYLTATGEQVTVGQLATVELNTSINTIRRTDRERTITVTADTDGTITPNEATLALQERTAHWDLPSDLRFEFGGEQEETAETFRQLYLSMSVAVILILIIMVIEFNSYRQPLLIFLSIPMALIGVLFGLFIFGGQLNFSAFIGLVSLTGIVVNNGILLVDRMNNALAAGHTLQEAVILGGTTRLRPVILTTLTTVMGIMPLLFLASFYRDLALTIITGLLFSTFLTLVFIPVLYYRQQLKLLVSPDKS